MGGKGASGPVATNDQMVAMQMQQAAQAKEANTERNARLQQGTQTINEMFQGHPTDAKQLDLSSLQGASGTAGLPANVLSNPALMAGGYYWDGSTWAPAPGMGGQLADGYTWGVLPDSGGNTQYGIHDPNGNLVTTANSPQDLAKSQIWYGGTAGGPTTGGVTDDFYNKFRQAIMDYYTPQEDEQYADARSKLSYSLARAGSLNSSLATMDVGKLAEQDTMNRAQIASQADNQTAGLRTQMQQDQQSALNQLYSTEDPTVAANTAGNMVANAQLTKPLLNPVGALFAPITAGVGNAISGFTNPYAYISGGAMGMGTGSAVSTPSPNTGQGSNVSAV